MKFLEDTIGLIAVALIGALIGTTNKRKQTPVALFISVIAGGTTAIIFTPIISSYINVPYRVDYAIGFLLGLLGMRIISILLAVFDTLKDNPKEIIDFAKQFFSKDKTTIINHYGDNKQE